MPAKLYEKKKILEKCTEVFAEKGYDQTSVVMLAKEAGVSRTLILHHFKSKKDLYLEIVNRIINDFLVKSDYGFISDIPDFFEAREALSRFKFQFSFKNPIYYKIFLEVLSDPPTEISSEMELLFGDYKRKLLGHWQQLFETVKLREGVNREKAFELVQMTLDYFDKKYFTYANTKKTIEATEAYFNDFLKERGEFLSMVRYGIQGKEEF